MLQRTDLKVDDIFVVAYIGDTHYEALAVTAADVEVLVTLAKQGMKLAVEREEFVRYATYFLLAE